MNYKNQLKSILNEMENERERVNKQLSNLPSVKLYYKKGKSKYYYFISKAGTASKSRTNRKPGLKSISKNPELIKKLLTAEYLTTKSKCLDKNIELLSDVISNYKTLSFNNIIASLPARLRNIPPEDIHEAIADIYFSPVPVRSAEIPIKPLAISYEGNDIYYWGREPYRENTKNPENKTHQGINGCYYRSMAEMSIASIYEKLEIPYHYDEVYETSPVLSLTDSNIQLNKWISPDFVFINKAGNYIYHEHWGLPDSDGYMKANSKKLYDYALCGIVPGKNLLITTSNDDGGINFKKIEDFISLYNNKTM